MVATNSPEGLPAGWTVQIKVLESGRKLKYYTDLKTGKKYYSMNEVYRCIKSKGNLKLKDGNFFKTQTSGRKCSKGSMKKYLHGIKRTNSDLGWLPKGWLIELRRYETGPKTGRQYKVYVDKSTGHKFYSKQEVLRYLKKQNDKASKQEVLRYLKKQNDKAHVVREIKQAIVTRSKSCVYENYSKTKLEEHLNAVEHDAHLPNKKKTRTSRSARNASSGAFPDLEIIDHGSPKTTAAKAQKLSTEAPQPRNSADKGTYVIRRLAMSDAHVNGVQTRGSKRRQQSDLDNGCTSTSAGIVLEGDKISSGKFDMHTTSKKKGSLPSRFSKRLAKLEPEMHASNDYALALQATSKRSGTDHKAVPLLTIDKLDEREKRYHSQSRTEIDPILKKESTVSIGKNSNDSSNNTENNRDSRLRRRFSKRLAGFEADLVSIPYLGENVVQGVGKRSSPDQAKSISASASTDVVREACQQHSAHVQQSDRSRGLGGDAGNTKSKIRHKIKCDDETGCSMKRLAGVEPEVVLGSVGEVKSRLPSPSQDILPETVGPCTDQETQQQNQKWHSWSDCLEFAFKTLTGEIPIEDDLQIKSYFQQIKNPAQKDVTADNASFGSPGCSLLDAPQKPISREQTQTDFINSGSAVGYKWINSPQANGGKPAPAMVKTASR